MISPGGRRCVLQRSDAGISRRSERLYIEASYRIIRKRIKDPKKRGVLLKERAVV